MPRHTPKERAKVPGRIRAAKRRNVRTTVTPRRTVVRKKK